ncbi:UxaA family hydrolase [Candidatus Formimonas warabiya]|uniref:D-galactarate dehydratase n=1 Tax=Formimonas warabiya TaxID=1761012 RepID=A0A3G1KPU8_FORW1|nr:UxaA family hydrolase [Candidatus Formimonas warabiya]ATW24460.1 D-galactarate dehydratase [Candidatus Formimonas warabiya]
MEAIVLNEKDNVATAVVDLVSGQEVSVIMVDDEIQRVKVARDISLGHKFALATICKGQPIVKYGEVIGIATEDIKTGGYVHVHNVESQRGRGDRL